jgi:hypothetical protein
MVWMTRVWPRLLGLSRVVQPDTILRGTEQGFGFIGAGNLAVKWTVGRERADGTAPLVIGNCFTDRPLSGNSSHSNAKPQTASGGKPQTRLRPK